MNFELNKCTRNFFLWESQYSIRMNVFHWQSAPSVRLYADELSFGCERRRKKEKLSFSPRDWHSSLFLPSFQHLFKLRMGKVSLERGKQISKFLQLYFIYTMHEISSNFPLGTNKPRKKQDDDDDACCSFSADYNQLHFVTLATDRVPEK